MIHKPTHILERFLTCFAHIDLSFLFHDLSYFLCTVDAQIMNDGVSFGQ